MLENVLDSQLTVAGVWIAAIGVIGLLIRQIVPGHRAASEAEGRLRDALIKRVDLLERKLERQESRHAAERALGNHQLRNVTACFDAMLLMLEMNPDRGPEIVSKIKEMRASQIVAETQEKAIIRAAEIAADAEESREAQAEEEG
jgi:hypothetical protein